MKNLYEEIKKGNLVILPTDTVYGISADALNKEAIKKVFLAKKRENKPLLIMVSSIEMLKKYVMPLSNLEESLMKDYWPGKLTILLNKNDKISNEITCDSPLIGVRLPENKMLIELIDKLNRPIISTSANISGEPVITNVRIINDNLKKHISYIYDEGEKTNVSSTIVRVEDNKIKFIREGELSKQIKEKYQDYIY